MLLPLPSLLTALLLLSQGCKCYCPPPCGVGGSPPAAPSPTPSPAPETPETPEGGEELLSPEAIKNEFVKLLQEKYDITADEPVKSGDDSASPPQPDASAPGPMADSPAQGSDSGAEAPAPATPSPADAADAAKTADNPLDEHPEPFPIEAPVDEGLAGIPDPQGLSLNLGNCPCSFCPGSYDSCYRPEPSCCSSPCPFGETIQPLSVSSSPAPAPASPSGDTAPQNPEAAPAAGDASTQPPANNTSTDSPDSGSLQYLSSCHISPCNLCPTQTTLLDPCSSCPSPFSCTEAPSCIHDVIKRCGVYPSKPCESSCKCWYRPASCCSNVLSSCGPCAQTSRESSFQPLNSDCHCSTCHSVPLGSCASSVSCPPSSCQAHSCIPPTSCQSCNGHSPSLSSCISSFSCHSGASHTPSLGSWVSSSPCPEAHCSSSHLCDNHVASFGHSTICGSPLPYKCQCEHHNPCSSALPKVCDKVIHSTYPSTPCCASISNPCSNQINAQAHVSNPGSCGCRPFVCNPCSCNPCSQNSFFSLMNGLPVAPEVHSQSSLSHCFSGHSQEHTTTCPTVKTTIVPRIETIKRYLPIQQRLVLPQREEFVRHVPVTHKYTTTVVDYVTRHVPVVKTRNRTVEELYTEHIPVQENSTRHVMDCLYKNVPILIRKVRPVTHKRIRHVPVVETRYRPVITETVTSVPVRQRYVKNLVEYIAKPYVGPCLPCGIPCPLYYNRPLAYLPKAIPTSYCPVKK